MCGFFGINKVDELVHTDFVDVKERGLIHFEKTHENFFSFQSVLPCTGNFCGTEHYETEDYIINYTGEIYNYDRFYKNDSLHLFNLIQNSKDWTFFDELNGMFAISIYNKNTSAITLVRDPIGQIPLFYYNQDCLIYSNTLPSLVKNACVDINPMAITKWLSTKHYIFNDTFWRNVYLFPKGNVTTFDQDGNVWNEYKIKKKLNTNSNLYQLLDSKTVDYTPSVDFGTILSGGVDSSIVSKVYAKKSKYIIGVNNEGKDYISNDIESFQKYFDNKIDILNVSEESWIESAIDLIQKLYTVPYSWSWVGYYIMSRKLRYNNDIHVCLTGEGADEIFGGYSYENLTNRSLTRDDRRSLKEYVTNYKSFNRLMDKEVFLPIGCIGSNLAMGINCIETRNPFLDHDIFYNSYFQNDNDKSACKKLFSSFFPKIEIKQKQGFAGFPNETYDYVNSYIQEIEDTTVYEDDENYKWKKACYTILKNL